MNCEILLSKSNLKKKKKPFTWSIDQEDEMTLCVSVDLW